MEKRLLALLLCVLALLTGVCPLSSSKRLVKAGEMVLLQCPQDLLYNHGDAKLVWTRYTTQEKFVANNMSSLEQWNMDVLVYGRSLVILSASVNHQGNYSCSLGNASSQYWFTLTVYSTQSREYKEKIEYLTTCYTQEICTLKCPHIKIPHITSSGITWYKEGESLQKTGYFSSVEKSDCGVYTCTRSYLYQDQIYNITLRVELDVKSKRQPVMLSPHNDDVFYVDLGSTLVIDCKAVMYSDFDEIFWLSNTSFVETNNSLPVFYNSTWEYNTDHIEMTASLVFKKVSEEDLLKRYTCKLESAHESSRFATITLNQKSHPVSLSPTLSIVGILVVIAVTVIVCVKFKIDIALFLRDTLGFHRGNSDGKSYDAFLMYYKSNTVTGLNEDNRNWLKSALEDICGYSLCLYEHDVLTGKEAVSDCIEQSRTVILVPSSPDAGPGSGLLNAIHAALVEQQTRLVFIKTETTEVSTSGSLPEALQVLTEAGDCVTWKGTSSMTPSSTFFKQLRYYLPAPQHVTKRSLLPQTLQV